MAAGDAEVAPVRAPYNARMSGRVLVMTGSLLLAGGVLGAAAWLGAAPPSDDGKPAHGQPASSPTVAPTDLTGLDIRPEDLTGGQRMEPELIEVCLLYTSPSPRDRTRSRMPSSA